MRRLFTLLLAALLGACAAAAVRYLFPPSIQTVETGDAAQAQRDAAPASTASDPAQPAEPETTYPTGYAVRGLRAVVQMSDGTTRIEYQPTPGRTARLGLRNEHGEVTDIDRNAVVIDGRKMHIKPAPRPRGSPVWPRSEAASTTVP